jgi:hypothetical protein
VHCTIEIGFFDLVARTVVKRWRTKQYYVIGSSEGMGMVRQIMAAIIAAYRTRCADGLLA